VRIQGVRAIRIAVVSAHSAEIGYLGCGDRVKLVRPKSNHQNCAQQL
jgi:hypothetical protein